MYYQGKTKLKLTVSLINQTNNRTIIIHQTNRTCYKWANQREVIALVVKTAGLMSRGVVDPGFVCAHVVKTAGLMSRGVVDPIFA